MVVFICWCVFVCAGGCCAAVVVLPVLVSCLRRRGADRDGGGVSVVGSWLVCGGGLLRPCGTGNVVAAGPPPGSRPRAAIAHGDRSRGRFLAACGRVGSLGPGVHMCAAQAAERRELGPYPCGRGAHQLNHTGSAFRCRVRRRPSSGVPLGGSCRPPGWCSVPEGLPVFRQGLPPRQEPERFLPVATRAAQPPRVLACGTQPQHCRCQGTTDRLGKRKLQRPATEGSGSGAQRTCGSVPVLRCRETSGKDGIRCSP